MASRRIRAFKRWMSSNEIELSDALEFVDTENSGICVKSKCDLNEGDLIATIPKNSCLTIRTSGASDLIASYELDGCLGLCVAVMYERSLGLMSPWAGYLQILPEFEPLPFVWSLDDIDRFLCGTELHQPSLSALYLNLQFFGRFGVVRQTVKEDKTLIYEDWKENILPLIHSTEFSLDANSFGVEDYFAAKSLVASRSFQIDDYHGSGMVPLADLFNHKTGAEDVHFTLAPSLSESDDEGENVSDDENDRNNKFETATKANGPLDDLVVISPSKGTDLDLEEKPDNPLVLEMILVKDVKVGSEVFNTYGLMGNAALLHRYGFTEMDNPYDIVNIDLKLVLQWSSSLFSSRHGRARLALWRKLGYSGCESQNSEYFEISYDGEPQLELLILLYIILLNEETYIKLDFSVAFKGNFTSNMPKNRIFDEDISEMSGEMLLTKSVCKALLLLADMRELLYGASSLEVDMENLQKCDCNTERKLYHSLVLRISERKIIQRLKNYANTGVRSLDKARTLSRKRLKS